MRESLAYYENSSSSVFYRPSKRALALFIFSGALFLWGCHQMAQAGPPSEGGNVPDFLVGALIACCGFFLSWFNGRRWMWFMIGIAILGRLLLLPLPVSEDLSRRMWEGEMLNANFNPYEVAPDAEEIAVLRDRNWERIRHKDQTSTQAPLSLAMFRLLNGMGINAWSVKFLFFVFDIVICIVLAMRYGTKRAALYGWNPLVAYFIAGEGHLESALLLPALGGFMIWDAWVDRKGGSVVIGTNGGLGGGPGQMVNFAAFLIGISAALNLVFLPLVFWMFWHVLSKSGIRTGLAIFLVGLIPLLVFSGWGAFRLNADLGGALPNGLNLPPETLSLVPGTLSRIGVDFAADVFYWIILIVSLILMLRNETMERFTNLYLGVYLTLSIAVFPWHFLWLAPFALSMNHLGFRLISISAFIYFFAFLGADGPVKLTTWQSAGLWIPLLIGLIWYAVTCRTRSDGFYVRSY